MTTAYEIYNGARARLGLNFDDGLLGSTNPDGVLSALNDGLAEMAIDHDWLFTFTEDTLSYVADIDSYDPPVGWLRTAFLVDMATGRELEPRQRREHFRYGEGGLPLFYDTSGDRILIAPTPSTSGTLRHGYFTGFERIVRDSDAYETLNEQLQATDLNLPSPYDTLAVLFVTRNLCLLMKDREAYQMTDEALRNYKRGLDDNRRRQQALPRIKARVDGY